MKNIQKASIARLEMTASMVIFGTIGIFVHYIPLPSSILALVRGIVGVIFLLLVVVSTKKNMSLSAIKRNLCFLIPSGIAIGINWILLFEAYHYTTVATATLCYYLAPIFVILISPLMLKEKLTVKKILCSLVALGGMVFVSGILETGVQDFSELKGILFGLGAALFYATVILLNKKLKDISAYDKTIVQLGVSVVVLLPYTLVTQSIDLSILSPRILVLLLIVGIVHTGMAYALYFGSMKELKAQTVAIFSYIDPVVAILLSALFLHQGLGLTGMLGAVMILGATFVSETVS